MNNALIKELFLENAMLEETRRMWRKWVAGGSKSGRVGNYAAMAAVMFAYLWALGEMVKVEYDFSIILEYIALILITLIMPASIYGAISAEREKATWDALILTRLTPAQIVTGKIGWRLLAVAGILLFIWPPMALTHGRGSSYDQHMSIAAILSAQAMLFAWAVLLCAFGLFISANSKNSVTAAGGVFGLLLGGLLLLPIVMSIFSFAAGPRNPGMGLALSFNPFVMLAEIAMAQSSEMDPIFWHGPTAGWTLTLIYSLIAAAFIAATHRRLHRLEEPQRRSG